MRDIMRIKLRKKIVSMNNNSTLIQSTSGANALQVDNENIKDTENEVIKFYG